jgi:signal peptidase II
MKKIHIFIIVALVLLADQALKIYVKTTFLLDRKVPLLGDWSFLYFVENPGMAYGMKFGGVTGKLALTIFRFIAVIFGTWYLGSIIKKRYSTGFIICASLIYAGALGNLIDSCFYGIIFDKGMVYNTMANAYMNYDGLATFTKSGGYASFLRGNVVDMLHFPIINGTFPSWFPKWGGEPFTFFSPIFNIADAAISTGVISIIVFQKKMFKQQIDNKEHHTIETKTLTDDASLMS